ncbi:MAG: pilus assembly protein TadG-related protein [Armatimonadota bacterium]
MRNLRRSRQGIVTIMAILGLLAMLGLAALTIDLGRMAMAAQRTQDVADAAAVAGAQAMSDLPVADARITDIVAANNDAISWPQVTVDTDSDVTFYYPGDDVPQYGVLDSDEHAVAVTTHMDDEFLFARATGQHQMSVARTSVAKVTEGDGVLPCLFAGDDAEWMNGLVMNGSHMDVAGDIHSNTRVVINGSHQTVGGVLSWRNSLTVNGNHNDFQGGTQESDVLAYPVDYEWSDYDNWDYEVSQIYSNGSYEEMEFGHVHVDGDMVLNGSHFYGHDGLVMVEGDVIVNGSHHTFENVTIIAKGSITFNGAAQHVSPYIDGLALMSLSSQYSNAITYNGAHQLSEGTLFAPNGGITYNGAQQETRDGSVIAKHITVNGSHFSMYGSEGGDDGEKLIQLIR